MAAGFLGLGAMAPGQVRGVGLIAPFSFWPELLPVNFPVPKIQSCKKYPQSAVAGLCSRILVSGNHRLYPNCKTWRLENEK